MTVIQAMFAVFNVALLGYVAALMTYQAFLASAATAHEGTPLGKRFHSIWAPLRGPSSFLMLTPLPWTSGFSLIQVTMLLMVSWSIGVADSVWSTFVTATAINGGATVQTPAMGAQAVADVSELLRIATISSYLNMDAGVSNSSGKTGGSMTASFGVTDPITGAGQWVFGVSINGTTIDPELGTVVVPCSNWSTTTLAGSMNSPVWSQMGATTGSPLVAATWAGVKSTSGASGPPTPTTAKNNPACTTMYNTVMNEYTRVLPIAVAIVSQNAQNSNVAPPDPSLLLGDATDMMAGFTTAAGLINSANKTAQSAAVNDFATSATQYGWASSAFYYYQLSAVSTAGAQNYKMLDVTDSPEDSVGITALGTDWPTYETALNAYITTATSESNVATQQPLVTGHVLAGTLTDILGYMSGGNALPQMVSLGNDLMGAGEVALGVGVVAGTAAKAVTGAANLVKKIPGGSKLINMVPGGAIATTIANLVGPLASALNTIGVVLFVQGLLLGYILPSLPAMIMTTAVIGWVFLVAELIVAAPVWAVAHAYADGEGFAPQQAQYGYGALIGVLMRPVALVFGFVFMFYIMNVAFWFAAMGLGILITGMTQNVTIGLGGFIGVITIIIITVFMIVRYVLGMMVHLAENLPRWMGSMSGSNTGDVQAANQAQSAGGSTASNIATQGAQQVVNTRGAYAAAKKERLDNQQVSADRAAKAQRHTDMMGALGHQSTAKAEGGAEKEVGANTDSTV